MSRRGNGEGTVCRRPDGRWEARITLRDGRRRSLYGRTRAAVADKLDVARRARRAGLGVVDDRMQLGTYLEQWLESVRGPVREKSWIRYEQIVRLQVRPAIGRITLARLQPHHIEQLYANALAGGLSARSVRCVHAVLRHALGVAEQRGLMVRNVAKLVKPPRLAQFDGVTLSEPEVRTLLGAIADHRLEALYVLAVTTGMRQGELLGLRWREVDLDSSALRVRRTLQRVGGEFRLEEPKTARSRRQIQLTRVAIAALRRRRTRQLEERVAVGKAWREGDLVFSDQAGGPLVASSVTKAFQRILSAAGLPRVRFHDLRHTAATLALGRGVHPKIVSEMLGHSSIAVTLDLYSHVTPMMQSEAAAVMDAVVGGAR